MIEPGQRQEKPQLTKRMSLRYEQNAVIEEHKTALVEDISEINILRQQMLRETTEFSDELDEIERQLIRRSNELEILTSRQMSQISQKNMTLVKEFTNYQEEFIKKLQGECSNWDKFENELIEIQTKLDGIMNQGGLVPKLARIEVLESEINELVEEVEDLKKKKLRLRG